MKLYTRTGDSGATSLFGGQRVDKDSLRIEACGCIDELNCFLGSAVVVCRHDTLTARLSLLQHWLFDLGAIVSRPGSVSETQTRELAGRTSAMEQWIDQLTATLPQLRNFILPGGCELSARLHLARAVCRRAERRCVTLARTEALDPGVVTLLNRLADLLFVLARHANQLEQQADVVWQPQREG